MTGLRTALRGFVTRRLFATCLPITLEAGHSATSGEQHARVTDFRTHHH
ncbi:MAG: hypothetical protein ACRDQY_13805 [Pseudonocardiaceae bacterium]